MRDTNFKITVKWEHSNQLLTVTDTSIKKQTKLFKQDQRERLSSHLTD